MYNLVYYFFYIKLNNNSNLDKLVQFNMMIKNKENISIWLINTLVCYIVKQFLKIFNVLFRLIYQFQCT